MSRIIMVKLVFFTRQVWVIFKCVNCLLIVVLMCSIPIIIDKKLLIMQGEEIIPELLII